MPRTVPAMSRPAVEAVRLLGVQVAQARRERGWTLAELAERAGVSPPTARKVEHGDPSVSIGIAFEVATLVGVPLFTADRAELSAMTDRSRDRLALLPQRVRPPSKAVRDDF